MNKIDLGQMVSILANVGVIAGIAFLAMELQQNNELMAVEARATRLSIQADVWGSITESPVLAPLLLKDRSGEQLTAEEEMRLNGFWMKSLLLSEWQYETTSGYEGWLDSMRINFLTYGSLRRTWQGDGAGARSSGKHYFGADFVQFIDDNAANR